MVLQALNRYYQILADDPDSGIPLDGYSKAAVHFALVISPYGELKALLPLYQSETRGKKVVEIPRQMIVPQQIKRAGQDPASNFLCDNSAFTLGISKNDAGDPSYAVKRFERFRNLHQRLLAGVDCPEARAVLAFLESHDPKQARENPLLAAQMDKLVGSNLVFQLEGNAGFIHDAPEIRRAWEESRMASDGKITGQCLVTGEKTHIARLHPTIKGVRDAQAMGVTLVSFNDRAYESYNRTDGQGYNAPTGEKAAFAYGTALNYLLSNESDTPKFSIGDSTVVYWAESPDKTYADLFSAIFDPAWPGAEEMANRRDPAAGQRLREIAAKVRSGAALDTSRLLEGLDPATRFYVLGLTPYAARLSVRFFHCDPFEKIVARIMAHYDDMQIEREFEDQPARISIRDILGETVSKKARDKKASPILAGALMRAILNDTPYPAGLFFAILNRVRADMDDKKLFIRKINYTRAAVIKAFLTRKYRHQKHSKIQEVLVMSLNEQSTHPAYLLGRLFAVLEKAQEDAIPGANATIKDRFFSSACASPVTVFPRLIRLSQHHMAKMETRQKIWYEKLFGQILCLLDVDQHPFPANLSMDDQGAFVLGYYHQRGAFFTPKNSSKTAETN